MQTLQTLLANFKPPRLTPEQIRRAEEWERAERRRVVAERMGRSRIPAIFRGADITQCDPKVQRYCDSLPSKTSHDQARGLVLQGKVGRGKTYAACAILIAHLEDYPVRFATMQGVLRDIQATYNGVERIDSVIARYRNVRVLVIDDFGKEQPTKWSLPIMFEIIDGRYSSGKPTIYTTQYRGIDLLGRLTVDGDPSAAQAIISRMSACETIVFSGDNRRAS